MLETLLDQGFARHATESERVAQELEAAADQARASPALLPRYLKLATHTIGEHLGDWDRASALGERTLADLAPTPETARAWAHLSIARLLAGDIGGAAAAEATALAAADDLGALAVEIKVLLAAALVGAGRSAEAARLYPAALELARRAGDAAPARAIAVASNNLAYDLVERPRRSADDDRVMRLAADAALAFWLKAGTAINEALALTLTARVSVLLGDADRALADADRALAILTAEDTDRAIALATRAAALGLAGDAGGRAQALAAADVLAASLGDAECRAFYEEQRGWIVGAEREG